MGGQEGAWLGGGGLRSWPGHGPGSPLRTCSCPVPTTISVEEAGSRPILYFWKFTVVVHQPKVIGLCFGIFFLVFRFFLNKVFF